MHTGQYYMHRDGTVFTNVFENCAALSEKVKRRND